MTQRNREAVSIDITEPLEKITGPSKGRVTKTNWVPKTGADIQRQEREHYTMEQERIQEEMRKRHPDEIRLKTIESLLYSLVERLDRLEGKSNV